MLHLPCDQCWIWLQSSSRQLLHQGFISEEIWEEITLLIRNNKALSKTNCTRLLKLVDAFFKYQFYLDCWFLLFYPPFSLSQKDTHASYYYGGWWSVWWTGSYSMVLSKAAFFHRKYLDMYTNQMPASIRDYVTRERSWQFISLNCLSS